VSLAGAQSTPPREEPVVLTPGDLVRVTVWQRPEFSGEYLVTPEGSLAHPLYQDVKVAGVPLAEAKARLRAFLAQTYSKDPQLTMEPLFRITVGGEVRAPNLYTVPRGTTVAQAVALAGGVTQQGKASKVRVIRRTGSSMIDITRPEPSQGSEQLVSGDQVLVSRGHNFFRDVLGPFSSITAAVVSIIVVVRQ
jgi:protein involved in polysaccharide export with SLBB domain